jgi:hypothetical protein
MTLLVLVAWRTNIVNSGLALIDPHAYSLALRHSFNVYHHRSPALKLWKRRSHVLV